MHYRFLCLMACLALPVSANPDLVLDSLTGTIELLDGKPPVTELTLSISNAGDEALSEVIGFRNAEQVNVELAPGDSIVIQQSPASTFEGRAGGLQTVNIDLGLSLPGDTSTSIGSTDIKILLPESAYPVVLSEPRLMDNTADATGIHYEYYKEHRESGPLTIVYNPGPVNLSVRKTLYPIPVVAGPVTVTIDVTNFGSEEAVGMRLTDHLMGDLFNAQGDAFVVTDRDGVSDLRWQTDIPSLAPGESTRVSYQVNALSDVGDTELPVTEASIGDELIGYSNTVWLPKWH